MAATVSAMPHSVSSPTNRPHPNSEIINRNYISDPQEDLAREQARLAESAGLRVVNNDGIPDTTKSPPASAPRRQDFSNEKTSKRDTRLGDYILGQTLGEGEFGKVKMGWKAQGGIQVAIKLIRREKLDTQQRLAKVYREINILRELNHPNIVKLHEMVETERTIGIILEYASGGELFDFILHERYLKDHDARRLFAQLVSGIGYLHKNGIIHRDLKLENLLLDRNNNIIITDFGFANTFDPLDELGDKIEARLHRRSFVKRNRLEEVGTNGFRRGDLMATSCGSPCYAAPELVISEGIYTGRKVDVWSCGVILYAMLAGYLPFDDDPANPDGDNINLLYRYISTAPLVFPEHVTPHARDLLRRILVPDPRKRADLFEVARHSWLSDYAHVVEFITSSSALPAGVSKTTMGGDGHYTPQALARSHSVRESSKTPVKTVSPLGGLVSKQGKVSRSPELEKSKPTPRDAKRRTVQVEYLPPQTQTIRGETKEVQAAASSNVAQDSTVYPLRQSPATRTATEATATSPATTNNIVQDTTKPPPPPPKINMPPPTRPARDVPRSTSDSTAFTTGQVTQVSRPATQGSITSSSRLPSRGSYAQPVAATVATASAQGHFSQPKPTSAGYVISAPVPQSNSNTYATAADGQSGRFEKQQMPYEGQTAKKRGHTRSNTFTDLGARLFGRSNSVRRTQDFRSKSDRAYPPTSMKQPVPTEDAARTSVEPRRSFGFGRRSTEFSNNPKRSSRRFSFIPRFGGGSKEETPPRTADTSRSIPYSQNFSGYHDESTPTQYSFGPGAAPPSSFVPPQSTIVKPGSGYGVAASHPDNPTTTNYSRATPRATSSGNPTASQQTWTTYQANQTGSLDNQTSNSPRNVVQPQYTSSVAPNTTTTTTTTNTSSAPAPSPIAAYAPREKENREQSDVWGSNRKWQSNKPGAAQRVMEFFRGRRYDRSGMT